MAWDPSSVKQQKHNRGASTTYRFDKPEKLETSPTLAALSIMN